MCGIVAAVARRNVVPILIEGLKRLEYRGYDSAGMAVINGTLHRVRACGRVAALEKRAFDEKLEGTIGIGHTRWATHGAPSERNAHPHVSGGVSLVHNGIIENHDEVRARLRALGYQFTSDTDTEVIAHLVHSKVSNGWNLLDGVRAAVSELKGAYAIAVIAADDPSRLVVARMGAPLLLGIGEGENFAASDTGALLQVTRNMIYLEEGDCAEVTPRAVRIVDARGHVVERPLSVSRLQADAMELGSYRHYMQKEIFEQPAGAYATLQETFSEEAKAMFGAVDGALILAC
ncbi:MAG TPA: glutamine--fructose-6-phosphate aminotransferase, partial [Burkholderiales bacterium]|nr:glutamine--fructose-6-phosphate aminotransferase [Burkholderiales bacterium]